MKFDKIHRRQNRIYTTKYDNEVHKFLSSIDTSKKLMDIAEELGVSYFCLYNSYKNNRIAYRLKNKIISTFNLTEAQLEELNRLVLK